jgi:predicted dehydrogenase
MIEDNQLWHSNVGDGEWKKIRTDRGELARGMRDNDWARGFTSFACKIVEALREGRTAVDGAATFADGYRTQLVLDAARRAHESGCWKKISR